MTSGGVEPREDVVLRAKAALEEMRHLGLPNIHTLERHQDLIQELVVSVPELVAELEAARSEVRTLRSQLIDTESALAASESYLAREVAESERIRHQPGCCCGGCCL